MSTESFLAIWPSQYKFLINEFLIRKKCVLKKNMKTKPYVRKKKYAIRLAKAKQVEKVWKKVNFEVDQGRFKSVVNGGLKQSQQTIIEQFNRK